MHDEAPGDEVKAPAGHLAHVDKAPGEYVPTGHFVCVPVTVQEYPAGHVMHDVEPAADA